MSPVEKRIIRIGFLALLLIPFGTFVAMRVASSPSFESKPSTPTPGVLWAQHWHMSFVLYVNGKRVDLGSREYMLRSKLAHFEDGDPSVIHKHTTGITLPYFLKTLKISLSDNCIQFGNLIPPETYCTNATSSLHTIINGEDMGAVENYELQNNDRILVYYGDDTPTYRKFLFNQVPPVPAFIEEKPDAVDAGHP